MPGPETKVLRSANRSNMVAFPPFTFLVKRLKLPEPFKILKAIGQGFAMGFAAGIVKSSIYQGFDRATRNQQGFGADAMHSMRYASGTSKGLPAAASHAAVMDAAFAWTELA